MCVAAEDLFRRSEYAAAANKYEDLIQVLLIRGDDIGDMLAEKGRCLDFAGNAEGAWHLIQLSLRTPTRRNCEIMAEFTDRRFGAEAAANWLATMPLPLGDRAAVAGAFYGGRGDFVESIRHLQLGLREACSRMGIADIGTLIANIRDDSASVANDDVLCVVLNIVEKIAEAHFGCREFGASEVFATYGITIGCYVLGGRSWLHPAIRDCGSERSRLVRAKALVAQREFIRAQSDLEILLSAAGIAQCRSAVVVEAEALKARICE